MAALFVGDSFARSRQSILQEYPMAVTLRLARRGAKKSPFYHIVATDSRNPRDGRFNEELGTYDPNFSPAKVSIKADRLEHWLKVGARPSATVANLIKAVKASTAKAPAAEAKK
jgi:small subunit ribosomal protein S16